MERYPAVRFLVAHGGWLSVVVALVPIAIAALGAWLEGWGALGWVIGVAAGVGLGFAFRTFAELTHIIAEMLLPQ